MLENYSQGSYTRQLANMLGEQVEELKGLCFNIKKAKFLSEKSWR